MTKTAWHFRCINGDGGTLVLPYAATAEEALIECRLSLGAKVQKVY
jgi:hypothetical protein